MTAKNLWRIILGTALILLIPLVAMQFTDEVDWSVADFVIMGVLIFSTGLALDAVASKADADKRNRFVISAAIIAVFLLVWVELAVGIFGTPFAGS